MYLNTAIPSEVFVKIYSILLILFLSWNLLVFFFFSFDKYRAKNNKWRIPEKTLLLSACFFGGIGAFWGMRMFHHKTRHKKFQILIPIFAVFSLAVFVLLVFFLTGFQF